MNIDLLKRLCETPGIPGREERVRELIKKEVKGLFDSMETDAMGSLICTRRPRTGSSATTKKKTTKKTTSAKSPTRVMLACHMDEIGFYVSHIDENGFLALNPAGGFDTRNLFSRRVRVCTRDGDLHGVMNPGGRPIHIASEEDKKKVPEVKEFRVDLGMSASKVKRQVRIGDMVVIEEPFLETEDKLVSKALDNRVACWLGIESVRALDKAKTPHTCEITVAFTVQEEVGLRGAKTAAARIKPDIGIGLDVTLACDTPGVPKEETVTVQGDGVGLHVMDGSFISDHTLIQELEDLAKKKRIKAQRTILARGGQDGAAIQQTFVGARAAGLTVGTRYIHTVTEMIDKGDLRAACDLLAAWMPTVK
ncbi:MAG: M20/M25/M40 family metallo-hydrolase [Phycisphaerales bacterium]